MSVNYSLDAATANAWALWHILFRWKGSLLKLIWREMTIWTLLMFLIYILNAYVLKNSYRENIKYLIDITSNVPTDGTLMFLLSYMTMNSLTRWYETFRCLAWPENAALTFKAYFNENAVTKSEARRFKRTVARYLTICYILIFRDVCHDIRKMFPTFQDMVLPGILTAEEVELLQSSRLDVDSCHYWVPIDWIVMLLRNKYEPEFVYRKNKKVRNKKESIMSEVHYKMFISEISKLRSRVGDVLAYDWVPLPIALIQSLTIFVYSTLVINCFQMQARIINSGLSGSDFFVESLSTLPFSLLYLSFLRISEVIINPFGADDDDFETQYLMDRHIKVLNEILCPEEDEKEKKKKE